MLHPILKEVENQISVVSLNSPNYDVSLLKQFNISKNESFEKFQGNIDWNKMDLNYTLDFADCGNEELKNKILNSPIMNANEIYLEIRYKGPVVKLKPNILAIFWEEFLHASVEGFPVVSVDGKFIMEFLSKRQLIYSNFKIEGSVLNK